MVLIIISSSAIEMLRVVVDSWMELSDRSCAKNGEK